MNLIFIGIPPIQLANLLVFLHNFSPFIKSIFYGLVDWLLIKLNELGLRMLLSAPTLNHQFLVFLVIFQFHYSTETLLF